jgi:hypothetical protein
VENDARPSGSGLRHLIDVPANGLVQYGSRGGSAAEVTELYNSLRHVNAGRKLTRDEVNEGG